MKEWQLSALYRAAGSSAYARVRASLLAKTPESAVASHLRRADAADAHLRAASMANQLSAAALERFGSAVFVFSSVQTVLHSTAAEAAEGVFRIDRRRVRWTNAVDARAFAEAWRRVTHGPRVQFRATADPSRVVVVERAELSHSSTARARAYAIVIVCAGAMAAFDDEALRALFGLTAAEAGLAVALCATGDLSAAATASGLRIATARSYLKRIFLKTDTNRQPDLLRLILPLASRGRR